MKNYLFPMLLMLYFLFGNTQSYAQESKSLKEQADAYAARGDYSSAAPLYKKCMKEDEKCLLAYIQLLSEEKVTPAYSDELYDLVYSMAGKGHARSQNYLGAMYRKGEGVSQNYTKAVEWYRKAAEQGYARAQTNLGWMYKNGYGVSKDYTKAIEWYRKAAEQGDATAQTNLGLMYKNGMGVRKNRSKAIEWFRKAANQEYADAIQLLKNLGEYY